MTTTQYEIITVAPQEIRKGDRFGTYDGGWVATGDAKITGDDILVPIRYEPDGGNSIRKWSILHPKTFPVGREVPEAPNEETFTIEIKVSGKKFVEAVSDMFSSGTDSNICIEIERLIGMKFDTMGNPADEIVMDKVRGGISSSNPILNHFYISGS